MKLFYSPGACSLAAHIILYELGEPFSTQRVVIAAGENLLPEYIKINPRGRVPVLLVDGNILRENAALLTWLGQRSGKYFPAAGTIAAARASEWLAWLTSAVHISFAQLWRGHRFSDDASCHTTIRARGLTTLEGQFAEIESALSGRRYALGDDFSVVDANLLPFYRWGSRVGFDMRARFPCWTLHAERLLERDAVRRTIAAEGIEIWPGPDAWVAEQKSAMTVERLQAFDRAWAERNVDALMAHVTPDVVYVASVGPEPGKVYAGAAAVRRGFEAMLAHDAKRIRRSGPAWLFGNRGVAQWSFEESGRVIEGIDLFEFAGDRIKRKDAYRRTEKD